MLLFDNLDLKIDVPLKFLFENIFLKKVLSIALFSVYSKHFIDIKY